MISRCLMAKIAVATDETTPLTDYVIAELKKRGFEVQLFSPLPEKDLEWVDASREMAEAIAGGDCDQGVLFCWTGTGSSIAANKVPGIRAALCVDAEEAIGARKWNHANVLVMSIRLTSIPVAEEILSAWFRESYGEEDFDIRNVQKLKELEQKYLR